MTLPAVLPLIGLDGIVLKAGGHDDRASAVCAMERKRRPSGTFLSEPVSVRFWRFVQKSDGCWLWLGTKSADGYGSIRHAGKMRKAHRVAYELMRGVIPDGGQICHHCDNPACVNPDHLFVGTNRDNMIDRQRKGRSKNLFPTGDQHPRSKARRHAS